MDPIVSLIGLVGLVVAAASLSLIATDLRRIRHRLETHANASLLGPSEGFANRKHPLGVLGVAGGFAVFVYRQGRWELESDLSAPGYEPSAPSIAGAYEGQVVKKGSRPSGQA